MIRMGTRDVAEANPQRYILDKGTSLKNVFIASPPEERPSPNAYLIKQEPHSMIRPHYHHASQFQVIVAGSGRIGRHDVRPLTLHYAGQQTGYGPLVAGPDGLWYFTLRAVTESGAWFLPESAKAADRDIPKTQMTIAPRIRKNLVFTARPTYIPSIDAPILYVIVRLLDNKERGGRDSTWK
jgi:hypothetical protein